MLIATWNLNNRVGKVHFRPEAADAAIAFGADILVFNEYYPKDNEVTFTNSLRDKGWIHQQISKDTGAVANRVLIVSKLRLEPLDLKLPDFDKQFPSNILCVKVPEIGISIVGVRVPWYEGKQEADLIQKAWDWLEATAAKLSGQPAIILGDLNVGLNSKSGRGGSHFKRILESGWHRAIPNESASFINEKGQQSEIDHILGSNIFKFSNARYITEIGGYKLAGTKDAISDHAALLAEVTV